jgi:hypothetical protein
MMDDLKRIAGLFQAKSNKDEVEEENNMSPPNPPLEGGIENKVPPYKGGLGGADKEYIVKIPNTAKKQDLIILKKFLK